MLISPGNRFIFVHVPKTGGSSVHLALKRFATGPGSDRFQRPVRRWLYWRDMWWWYRRRGLQSLHAHATVNQISAAIPDEFRRYFTFAFVRNPWDWHVSFYHYTVGRKPPEDANAAEKRDYRELTHAGSFSAYVRDIAVRHRFCQASHLVDSDGEIAVDFVGRMEQLPRDFQLICRRVRLNRKLPHSNGSDHRNYREYYDTTTRDIIEDISRRDCELFGYCFDGVRTAATDAACLNATSC